MPYKVDLFAKKDNFGEEDVFGVEINETKCDKCVLLNQDTAHTGMSVEHVLEIGTTSDTLMAKATKILMKELAGNEKSKLCRRRMALADVFENISEEEMARVLALYVNYQIATSLNEQSSKRRGAKPNIFEGLSTEMIENIIQMFRDSGTGKVTCAGCDFQNKKDNSDSGSCDCDCADVSLYAEGTSKCRRGAKFDIFDGVSEEDKQAIHDKMCDKLNSVFQTIESCSESDSCPDCSTVEEGIQNRRRGGKFDIFEDLSPDQRRQLISYLFGHCHSCLED